jgi:antibiotic biosynthesis monooxygenase (ABM) superfamily enzyme
MRIQMIEKANLEGVLKGILSALIMLVGAYFITKLQSFFGLVVGMISTILAFWVLRKPLKNWKINRRKD